MAKTKDPFDFENPVEKALRDEVRRQKELEKAMSPFGTSLQSEVVKIAREHALARERYVNLLGPDTFRTIREVGEEQRRFADAVKQFVTPASLLAMQQTASAISKSYPEFQTRAKQIASGLTPMFKAAADSMQANADAMARVFSSIEFQDQISAVSRAAADLMPNMAAISASAEMLRKIEIATLKASAQHAVSLSADLEFIALQTDLADRAIANLAETNDPSQVVHLLTNLVCVLASFFQRFRENTVREVTEMGLIGLIVIAIAVIDAIPEPHVTELSSADREQVEAVDEQLASLREQLHALGQAMRQADEQFVAGLPRAETKSFANVRIEPSGSSRRLYRLGAQTPVAIAERRGHWRKVVYRDELTNSLSRGWVYSSSLTEF